MTRITDILMTIVIVTSGIEHILFRVMEVTSVILTTIEITSILTTLKQTISELEVTTGSSGTIKKDGVHI